MIKIRQTILARSIRFVSAIYALEYRPELIRRIQERYGFLKGPVTPDEMLGVNPFEGIKFQHGKFVHGQKTFVVENLQFATAPTGASMIICDTRTSTDDADSFLEEYIKQSNLSRPDMIAVTEPPMYLSQIEFSSERSVASFCDGRVAAAAENIDSVLASYGLKLPTYEVVNLNLFFDASSFGGGMPPANFTIERRAGLRHSANVYFSQAPLKTGDHTAILERLFNNRR